MTYPLRDAIWLKLAHKDGLSVAEIIDRCSYVPKPKPDDVVAGIARAIRRHKVVH